MLTKIRKEEAHCTLPLSSRFPPIRQRWPWPILDILFIPFGFIRLPNLSISSVPDECLSRKASCSLNWMSTFLFLSLVLLTYWIEYWLPLSLLFWSRVCSLYRFNNLLLHLGICCLSVYQHNQIEVLFYFSVTSSLISNINYMNMTSIKHVVYSPHVELLDS